LCWGACASNIHSGPTPRGREDSEDRVSAVQPVTATREMSSRDLESGMIDRMQSGKLYYSSTVLIHD
jgi:hypothetical protein